jgi:hypothetical protein
MTVATRTALKFLRFPCVLRVVGYRIHDNSHTFDLRFENLYSLAIGFGTSRSGEGPDESGIKHRADCAPQQGEKSSGTRVLEEDTSSGLERLRTQSSPASCSFRSLLGHERVHFEIEFHFLKAYFCDRKRQDRSPGPGMTPNHYLTLKVRL